ncbi:c-type cytochrome [Phreatobacter stygius]|uniref:C-type cytochrome n=1 Tax=Phreatobacter stygius TaxID=1940610 RepID=A0A4D7BK88_9HYPH|nr:c-type cytochrome [Phreatobacter stygius]QCI68167.1 c-type cytochrome [Phreatobacter stygius]
MSAAPRPVLQGLLAAATGIIASTAALAQVPRPGDRALGEYLAGECVTCHQVSGRAGAGIPPIIGWPADQFVAVMQSYRAKDRDNPIMQTVAGRFSDDEMAALAAYFGSLTPPQTK